MANVKPVVVMLRKLISIAKDGLPPPDQGDERDRLKPEDISPEFSRIASALVAVANATYRSAGGKNEPSERDQWMFRDGKLASPVAYAPSVSINMTPFGVLLASLIEGVLSAFIIAETYGLTWIDDEDRFFNERIEVLMSWISENSYDPAHRDDPALRDILDSLKAETGVVMTESLSRAQAASGSESSVLLERWSKLAGIMIKE